MLFQEDTFRNSQSEKNNCKKNNKITSFAVDFSLFTVKLQITNLLSLFTVIEVIAFIGKLFLF